MIVIGILLADMAYAADDGLPNAAAFYEKAFDALPEFTTDEREVFEFEARKVSTADPEVLKPLVQRFEPALSELSRAAQVDACDWNLDPEAGWLVTLPPLSKATELGRAAVLRGRLRFATNATDEGIVDILAALKLARHIGGMSLFTPLAADATIEKIAVKGLATHLPRLNARQLDRLSAALQMLPDTVSLADCAREEEKRLVGWMETFVNANLLQVTGPDAGSTILDRVYRTMKGPRPPVFPEFTVADMRESVQLLRSDYAELRTILELPRAEQSSHLAKWREKRGERTPGSADRIRQLSSDMVPNVEGFVLMEDVRLWNRQLLLLAIEVLRRGPSAVERAEIPGHGPVVFRPIKNGFEIGTQAAVDAAAFATPKKVERLPRQSDGGSGHLEVGDPAPPLTTGRWVHGAPVTEFSRDKAYLIDFWATWCGPCLESLPHLSTIATRWQAQCLVVIAQNARDGDDKAVRQVIEDLGDACICRFALDDTAGKQAGAMAFGWLDAAQCRGLPWTFLVGKDGRIAWIGHPKDLKVSVVEEVLTGTFDMTKAMAEYRAAKAAEQRAEHVTAQIRALERSQPNVPALRVGLPD